MVLAYFPQRFNGSITANTNYPPQNEIPGAEPTFDDEDFFIGAERDSTQFLLDAERNSVDFELVL